MRRLLPLVLLLALAGCIGGPDPLTLADDPLVELYRMPAPVPAPADGRREWAFTDRGDGLVAEGRRLASIDFAAGRLRWAIDLPPAYAVRAATDVLAGAGLVVLVGATSLRAVSRADGSTRWDSPAGGPAVLAGPVVVTSACTAARCALTGIALDTGDRMWTSTTAGRVTPSPGPPGCGCLYATGRDGVSAVAAETGRTLWTFRTRGPAPVLHPSPYRLTVVTPPTAPDCVATVRGVEDGKQVWSHRFAWDDAGALAEHCRFDPGRLHAGHALYVPLRDRVAVLDEYHGTYREVPLLTGEFVVDGALAWSPTTGYRVWLDRPAAVDVPAPAAGPWARPVAGGWLLASGRGVVLWDDRRGVRRRAETASVVLAAADDRLILQERDTLVAVGPAQGRTGPAR